MKKFMNQDISGDALAQFKCEVNVIMEHFALHVILYMIGILSVPVLFGF